MHLGHGVGLRREHYREMVTMQPDVDWLEVITENFLVAGGNPRRVLRAVRARWPVVLHGVSLSLGGSDPLDEDYLSKLEALAAEIEPEWISDHLCWGGFGGRRAHDLLPLPMTEESLAHVVSRVEYVQERLGRRILVENVSSYVTFRESTIPEWEFLAELTRRADCKLLVDINNIIVSAHNHGFDPHAYLRALPPEVVGQYHLAGHSHEGNMLIDTHDHPVPEAVWSLYREAVETIGARATLVEWDAHVPPLDRVLAESRRAEREERSVLEAGLAA